VYVVPLIVTCAPDGDEVLNCATLCAPVIVSVFPVLCLVSSSFLSAYILMLAVFPLHVTSLFRASNNPKVVLELPAGFVVMVRIPLFQLLETIGFTFVVKVSVFPVSIFVSPPFRFAYTLTLSLLLEAFHVTSAATVSKMPNVVAELPAGFVVTVSVPLSHDPETIGLTFVVKVSVFPVSIFVSPPFRFAYTFTDSWLFAAFHVTSAATASNRPNVVEELPAGFVVTVSVPFDQDPETIGFTFVLNVSVFPVSIRVSPPFILAYTFTDSFPLLAVHVTSAAIVSKIAVTTLWEVFDVLYAVNAPPDQLPATIASFLPWLYRSVASTVKVFPVLAQSV
jgi:hypothetical protein